MRTPLLFFFLFFFFLQLIVCLHSCVIERLHHFGLRGMTKRIWSVYRQSYSDSHCSLNYVLSSGNEKELLRDRVEIIRFIREQRVCVFVLLKRG